MHLSSHANLPGDHDYATINIHSYIKCYYYKNLQRLYIEVCHTGMDFATNISEYQHPAMHIRTSIAEIISHACVLNTLCRPTLHLI